MSSSILSTPVKKLLMEGTVIPAHPLALNESRKLDERHQRALTRYYIDSGAGGVAVGVHTTQFEIRLPEFNLFETVLRLASEEIGRAALQRPFIKVAGIVGPVHQAVKEAELARKYGYDLGLLSNGGLPGLSEKELIERVTAVADIIPLFGFYLQPAVGGRLLSFDFWNQFAEIKNVQAIKVAAFNRYQTLDVMRAVCQSGRANEVALYTGNDDNIVGDLLTPYRFEINGRSVEKKFVGGLLGHWAFWTRRAVELLESIKQRRESEVTSWLAKGVEITDVNAAVFDPAHDFHGCISGINEVMRRQGLLSTNLCLNVKEKLSPGQSAEIDRVTKSYSGLTDNDFVRQNLDRWLSDI